MAVKAKHKQTNHQIMIFFFSGGQDTSSHLNPGQILVSTGPPGITPAGQIFVSSGPPSGQLVTVIHSSGPGPQSGSPAPVMVGQVMFLICAYLVYFIATVILRQQNY